MQAMKSIPATLGSRANLLATAFRRAGALILTSLLAACAEPAATTTPGGISGMAQIDDSRYLFVRDLKGFESGARLGVLQLNADQNYSITDVDIADWRHADGPASDLEAMCAMPGLSGEFLLLESGHWEGRFGRLFRVRLTRVDDAYSATVMHVFELPEFDSKGPNDPGDEMEGLACAAQSGGQVLVILGERGSSAAYPNGLLRWLTIDPETNSEAWTDHGRTGLEVDAPRGPHDPQTGRDISALHLSPDGRLWAAAAEDASDAGPFNSIVYPLGTVLPDEEAPIQLAEAFRVHGVLSGFKVEALASGTSTIPGTSFAVGTEDEIYGGTWRPLR